MNVPSLICVCVGDIVEASCSSIWIRSSVRLGLLSRLTWDWRRENWLRRMDSVCEGIDDGRGFE